MNERRLQAAIRSGKVVVIPFEHPGGMDDDEIAQRAVEFGKANGIRILMIGSTAHQIQLMVDPSVKAKVNSFSRELEKAKVHTAHESVPKSK